MTIPTPTAHAAAVIAAHHLGSPARTAMRLPTGLVNFVYAVTLADERRVVVRLNRPGQGAHFAAAARWSALLRPLGVPLPALLHAEPQPPDNGFPSMIMEHPPGQDLGAVYPHLSTDQKAALAERIAAIQRAVGTLPLGPGYGYAASYDDPGLHPTWEAVLRADLTRSAHRIASAGIVSAAVVERVLARLPTYATALAHVEPRPFLDDTTTKNVLVHDGALSGIVDVDCVCFGDPLLTVALTRMALLSRGFVPRLRRALVRRPGPPRRATTPPGLYTAIFCVGFLGELGQRFNADRPAPVDPDYANHLLAVLDALLTEA